jgi:hypothetical protein
MQAQEAASDVEELLAEGTGLSGRALLGYRCHEIILAGYFKNSGLQNVFERSISVVV